MRLHLKQTQSLLELHLNLHVEAQMLMTEMSEESRLRLVQMACVAAWSDLEVRESERAVVLDFVRQLELDESAHAKVETWLREGPPEVDPYEIPQAMRRTFVSTFLEVVAADGRIDPNESEMVQLLIQLTH